MRLRVENLVVLGDLQIFVKQLLALKSRGASGRIIIEPVHRLCDAEREEFIRTGKG
jgi:hypothetical protein